MPTAASGRTLHKGGRPAARLGLHAGHVRPRRPARRQPARPQVRALKVTKPARSHYPRVPGVQPSTTLASRSSSPSSSRPTATTSSRSGRAMARAASRTSPALDADQLAPRAAPASTDGRRAPRSRRRRPPPRPNRPWRARPTRRGGAPSRAPRRSGRRRASSSNMREDLARDERDALVLHAGGDVDDAVVLVAVVAGRHVVAEAARVAEAVVEARRHAVVDDAHQHVERRPQRVDLGAARGSTRGARSGSTRSRRSRAAASAATARGAAARCARRAAGRRSRARRCAARGSRRCSRRRRAPRCRAV